MVISDKKIAAIFIFLISLQMLFSFLFPAYYADSAYWRTINDLGFDQRYSLNTSDSALIGRIYPLIADYHLNLDAAGYMLIAHDFPLHYFKGNYTLLTRPLYPILVGWVAKPFHFISNSYSITFAAGLLTNLALFSLAVFLFYQLVKKFISFRIAFLSSILLIFSPLGHIWLVQPETNIFAIFAIVATLYMLDNYIKAPSLRKLIIFSLALGVLFLGKKIAALSIFILLLALFFKRYKEGAIFLVFHLLPMAFWLLWITQVWGLPLYVDEISRWGIGSLFLDIFKEPWYQSLQTIISSVANFISMVISGFILLPLIFAFIGYRRLILRKKEIFIFSFVFAFFLLIFGMQIYIPRYGFWLFPLVYPLAVLGIDEATDFIGKYQMSLAKFFRVLIYLLIILISSSNIYKFIWYG